MTAHERRRILRFLQFQARTGFGLDREQCKFDPQWLASGRRHADYDADFEEWRDYEEAKEGSVK
jgi:hypothetical protein